MARVDDFDAFYHDARTPLLHQTYALTGNADRAAGAVEDAFARAWSQWRKVGRLQDPAAWVRDVAWRLDGGPLAPRRRRPGRRGRPAGGASTDHPDDPVLQALRERSDGQRRALVLHHLAALPVDRIARELGVTESSAATLLAGGEQDWPGGSDAVRTGLAGLERHVLDLRLTRAPSLRRAGERRSRRHAVVGVLAAAALLGGGGMLIADDSPGPMEAAAASAPQAATAGATPAQRTAAPTHEEDAPPAPVPAPTPTPFLLDRGALLTAPEMARLPQHHGDWTVRWTTDGTTGDPIYAPCQRNPFADPDGNQALLRRFTTEGRNSKLSVVQVIEESRNERQSAAAFGTMQGWYGRCGTEGVQLLRTLTARGLGDEATAFQLREVGRRDTFLTVGMARTGPVTTAVIAFASGDAPVPAQHVLDRAAVSVTRMCLRVSGDCSSDPQATETAPLPTREFPGFLASYDLPPISNVAAPWVGTDPHVTQRDPASTPCDRANFGRGQHPRTRVFVLPTANRLPPRFGLTETVGVFASPGDAKRFVARADESVQGCPERELSASVARSETLPGDHEGRVWRFEFEVQQHASVFYRVGLVRSGRRVALLSMSPTESFDVTHGEFTDLVLRASHRLSEASR
jgi:DNA-directed RNA polymerase specialized sigma24 family protein